MITRPNVDRILQVHTRYRQAGGEDLVVAGERRLLEDAGVAVAQVIFDNAELRESQSMVGDLRLAASAVWSRSAKRRVEAAIRAHRPQVVHVHNTFPSASPSVYVAARGMNVPVVQTLHNYRFVCPVATLYRDGRLCTDCVGRAVPWPGVVHACVRDSYSQSAVAAATLAFHRIRGTYESGITRYIALTAFQRQQMIDGGLPAERIQIVPNFLEPDPGMGVEGRAGIVFVGRLTREKGIVSLLEAIRALPGVVRIAGVGPLADLVRQAANTGDAIYLGALPRASVPEELRRSVAVVIPSVWFEGFPLVVLEAFANGTPVIGSKIGSIGELVEDGVTGLLFAPGDAVGLRERMQWALDHPKEMGVMGMAARSEYEERFRGKAHLAALSEVYAAAVASSQETRR